MNHYPIADLHCDLLCYLAENEHHSPYDPCVRCSIPQLKAGYVHFQVMAIFAETIPGSSQWGQSQMKAFKNLLANHSDVYERFQPEKKNDISSKIAALSAIESASSFSEEEEPLEDSLNRLAEWQAQVGKFAYVSLTWNTENRFGGGAHTHIGLKEDGKHLLEYLSECGIPVDFSHTSDSLAYDILNHIDKKGLQLRVVASHSNARSIRDVPRNLPDELIKELVRRDGLIGMNLIRNFVGESSPNNFSAQLEHFLSLNTGRHLCLGADFFHNEAMSIAYRKPPEFYFFPGFSDASAYPKLIDLWRSHGVVSEEMLPDICYNNVIRFYSS